LCIELPKPSQKNGKLILRELGRLVQEHRTGVPQDLGVEVSKLASKLSDKAKSKGEDGVVPNVLELARRVKDSWMGKLDRLLKDMRHRVQAENEQSIRNKKKAIDPIKVIISISDVKKKKKNLNCIIISNNIVISDTITVSDVTTVSDITIISEAIIYDITP
jgi:hypothetical protein